MIDMMLDGMLDGCQMYVRYMLAQENGVKIAIFCVNSADFFCLTKLSKNDQK